MFPPVIYLVYLGGYFFAGLLLLTYLISLYEWIKISAKTNFTVIFYILGFLYLSIAYYLFFHLRDLPEVGLTLTVLTFFCVWSSDSFAYIFGKLIGGPKLLPMISPNKTRVGLAGAMFGPVFILVIGDFLLDFFNIAEPNMSYLFMVTFGCTLGVVAQTGDLIVSALKRSANVKDTGNIIPGHGGLLDRIDALILAAPVFYIAAIMFLVN